MYRTCGTTPKGSNTGDIWTRFFSALLPLLFDWTALHTHTQPAKSICRLKKKTKNPTATHIYEHICYIIKRSLSAMFTTLYSITHRSRTFDLCTPQKRQRRGVLGSAALICFKGFASTLSCALYRSFFLTLYLNINCRWTSVSRPPRQSWAQAFSITVTGSISYLWYDSCPLEMVSFYRRDHWLTHFVVNHAYMQNYTRTEFLFMTSGPVCGVYAYVYMDPCAYIWPRRCIDAWLVQHIFYGRAHLSLLFAQ